MSLLREIARDSSPPYAPNCLLASRRELALTYSAEIVRNDRVSEMKLETGAKLSRETASDAGEHLVKRSVGEQFQ